MSVVTDNNGWSYYLDSTFANYLPSFTFSYDRPLGSNLLVSNKRPFQCEKLISLQNCSGDQGQRQGSTTILNWLYTTVSLHLMIVNVREWSRPILKMRILADPCTKLKSTKAQQVFEFSFWASKMTKFEYSHYSPYLTDCPFIFV